MSATAHTTDFDRMGLKTHSPFNWRAATPQLSDAEKKRLANNAYQREYEANRRAKEREAMRKAAERVNPENFSCASFTPKSQRAGR